MAGRGDPSSAAKAASLGARGQENAAGLLRLLHAVDCFPRGGCYTGFYALSAALRYEKYWTALMPKAEQAANIRPPLDVAFAWFVHRQDPAAYVQDVRTAQPALADAADSVLHPKPRLAFGFDVTVSSRKEWEAVSDNGYFWPPPPPGAACAATTGLAANRPVFALQLAESMRRYSWQLRTWMRPHFLDLDFLKHAQARYGKFLELHAAHPDVQLVPAADIALLWHTHVALSGEYAAACKELFGAESAPWRPDYVDLDAKQMAAAYAETGRLYAAKFGDQYDNADCAWLPDSVSYPLAAGTSPIAFALRVYDENPELAKQQPFIDGALAAAAAHGVTLQAPAGKPAHCGAHALYAAWLAAGRAHDVYDGEVGCCGVSSGARSKAFKHACCSLVSIAFFLELPAWDTHPYLTGIVARPALLWSKTKGTGRATADFNPADTLTYLHARARRRGVPHEHLRRLLGVNCVILQREGKRGAYMPEVPPSAPLWMWLFMPSCGAEAAATFRTCWSEATKLGVTPMRGAQLQRRNSLDRGVAPACDYYTVSPKPSPNHSGNGKNKKHSKSQDNPYTYYAVYYVPVDTPGVVGYGGGDGGGYVDPAGVWSGHGHGRGDGGGAYGGDGGGGYGGWDGGGGGGGWDSGGGGGGGGDSGGGGGGGCGGGGGGD